MRRQWRRFLLYWILLSVFMRNQFGIDLRRQLAVSNATGAAPVSQPAPSPRARQTYRFWRAAFASFTFVRKDFWEG